MTKKTKIIVICIAAAVALSAVTAAVISLSRRNKKPADETVDSSSVSQESSSAPDFALNKGDPLVGQLFCRPKRG